MIGVSIGRSLAPTNAVTPDELMRQADMALYQAKGAGRGTVCFFKPEVDARLKARRDIESDLRRAIMEGELQLLLSARRRT